MTFHQSNRGDRGRKQGRTFFLLILAVIVFLFLAFLLVRPRGSQTGSPAQSTQRQ
jgi:preprotein translocase subunit YajC